MASVRRVPKSPFWIAKYRDGSSIKFRSTKQRLKSAALKVALDWEDKAKLANQGELTQATVLKFANELLERLGQGSVGKESTEVFASRWLDAGLKAPTTRRRYKCVVDGFLEFLGPKRRLASIGSITAQELETFRDKELSQGKSTGTAEFNLKVLRALMESAKRQSQRLDNPADGVSPVKAVHKERKPFTDAEIKLILSRADEEWRGMVLFGAFAGVRLNDAANILWKQIDLAAQSLTYLPAKTALRNPKPITVALHENILAYLDSRRKPRAVTAPLFPSLAGKKSGSAGGLSNQFADLLIGVGLREQNEKGQSEKSETEGRTFYELGFHSTRHYFISKMANADVPQEVRKLMAGHAADKAHEKYVHLELETQRRALGKLPVFEAA